MPLLYFFANNNQKINCSTERHTLKYNNKGLEKLKEILRGL